MKDRLAFEMGSPIDLPDSENGFLSTRHGKIDFRRRTAVMGIVNVTPDSFSDGGRYFDPERAVAHGVHLAEEGADVIDIGGESTRPGALPVPVEDEVRRVVPVVRGLRRALNIPLSIDTAKVGVAKRALEEGADLVNDISALSAETGMVSLLVKEGVPIVLMHMQGIPRTMQARPRYRNVVQEVKGFLQSRMKFCIEAGVDPARIIIDPGIGFGKDLEHNLTLLRGLPVLGSLGCPLLVGVSRKTFIGQLCQVSPDDRLEGSLGAAVLAAANGVHVVRVHDVKETVRALRVADAIRFGPREFEVKGSA